MDLSIFEYEENGVRVLSPCLELVVFSGVPMQQGAPGFGNFYHTFMKRFGDELVWYNTNDMKGMKRIDQSAREIVPFWFTDETSMKQDILGMRMHSGATPQDATPPAFEMICIHDEGEPPYAFCRMVLPHRWGDGSWDSFIDVTRSAVTGLPLLSGYAGYSFFWRVLDPVMSKKAAARYVPWMRRHPGFAHGNTLDLADVALAGLVNINWLTLVGQDCVERLGGTAALAEALGQEIAVHALADNNGAIIQAGPQPEIGDVNRRENLPLYHGVGQALRALRVSDEVAAEAWIEGFDPDEMEAWLGRFFDESD